MEDLTKAVNDLKVSLEELAEENQSLKTEVMTLKELKKDNDSLKTEVQAMRFEMFTMLKQIQQNQVASAKQEGEAGQQGCPKDERIKLTSSFPFKWGCPSLVTQKEKKDLHFSMFSRQATRHQYSCDEKPKDGEAPPPPAPYRFYHFTRSGEYEYDRDTADDGISNSCSGTFTTPMFGRYRFDVVGMVKYIDEDAIINWYICCIRKEDDVHDDENPENSTSEENVDKLRAREKVFKEERKRQLLFSLNKNEDRKEASVGIDCDGGIRVWVEVEIVSGDLYSVPTIETTKLCKFMGRYVD